MAKQTPIPELERLSFFPGQRLRAKDLNALDRTNEIHRQLHFMGLHASPGIGIGFGAKGEQGDTAVIVESGYAVDCLGRGIILFENRQVPVPAISGGPMGEEAVRYLVAAYREDEDQKIAERRPGVCLPEGIVRLSEEPAIAWRSLDGLREGLDIVLGQAWIRNCKLSRPISWAPRRYARPSDQPFVASGQTEVGSTTWTSWRTADQWFGVMTEVDTQAAQFNTTPHYLAHIVGERTFEATPDTTAIVMATPAVVEPTRNAFTLLVRVVFQNTQSVNDDGDFYSKDLCWHVVWTGIET